MSKERVNRESLVYQARERQARGQYIDAMRFWIRADSIQSLNPLEQFNLLLARRGYSRRSVRWGSFGELIEAATYTAFFDELILISMVSAWEQGVCGVAIDLSSGVKAILDTRAAANEGPTEPVGEAIVLNKDGGGIERGNSYYLVQCLERLVASVPFESHEGARLRFLLRVYREKASRKAASVYVIPPKEPWWKCRASIEERERLDKSKWHNPYHIIDGPWANWGGGGTYWRRFDWEGRNVAQRYKGVWEYVWDDAAQRWREITASERDWLQADELPPWSGSE